MDALLNKFAQLSCGHWPLYISSDGGVYCGVSIPQGTILGQIIGEPRYIWEIDHDRYMIVNRDYVIDVSGYGHDIVTAVREENATMNAANCTIVDVDDHFFLQTTVDVAPHTELVYYQMWM